MVYVLLADGFEEIEALTPVDLLRRAGVSVTVAGVTGKKVTGSHGIVVETEMTAEEAFEMLADGHEPEMIVLPGGMPGAKNLDESPVVEKFLTAAGECKYNVYLAAICAAPMILGKRGLLQGKKAVCYPGFEEYLIGADVLDERCACAWDGNIITGRAMGAATEFALTLVEALKGESTAKELRAAILYE